MPLMHSKSKKAFSKNVEAEMNAGKPQDQSLAVAYAVKRKASKKSKKMAEGGEVNAKNERRPMPDNRYDDSKMISRNSGDKPSSHDSWTDNSTIEQAQRPSKTKLSRPKLVGSDAFSVRYKAEIDEDNDRMNSMPPESDLAQPPKRDDEEGANRQGPDVRDMAAQHNNKRPPYNKAIEDQYAQDMAAAEMKKVQSYAQGGPVMEPEDHGLELMERSDEAHLMSEESPSEDEGDAEAHSLNEERPNRQGDDVPDMEEQHNSGRKPYYMGGPAVKKDHPHLMFEDNMGNEDHEMELNAAHGKYSPDDSEDQPQPEEDMEHEDSIAAAIMSKKQRGAQRSGSPDDDHAVMMADGGILSHGSMDSDDSDQADLSRNADEDANEEDQASFDSLRKENYSESAGLRQMDSPDDSAQHGDDEESDSENEHDKIDKMRSRMNMRRQFKQR